MSTDPAELERRASASAFLAVLQQTAALLNADPAFVEGGRVSAVAEDVGDVDAYIVERVGSVGIGVVVQFVEARDAKETLPGPVFGSCQYLVEICELPPTNRGLGGRTCLEVAEHAARILHQAPLDASRRILVSAVAKFGQPPEPATVCYHVILKLANVSINRKDP